MNTEFVTVKREVLEQALTLIKHAWPDDDETSQPIIDALRAALEQPGVEPYGWRPIDTAPKDGTAVLVMRDIWPGAPSGHAESCNEHNTYVAAWWGGDNAWGCYMDSVCDPQCPVEPTHWMPLPRPPSAPQPAQHPDARKQAIQECIDRLIFGGQPAAAQMLRHHFAKDLGEE